MKRVVAALACALGLAGCSGSKAGPDHSVASFCALAKAQEVQTAAFNEDFATGSPSQLKPVIDRALAQYAKFDDAAPEAIAAAVRTYVTDERAFLTIIKNNGYTITRDPTALQKAVSDPAFTKAGQQLTTYLISTCHLGPPASATPTPTGG